MTLLIFFFFLQKSIVSTLVEYVTVRSLPFVVSISRLLCEKSHLYVTYSNSFPNDFKAVEELH